jgi:hypothetical protein
MHNSITIFLFVAERYNMGDKAILVTRDPVFVNKNVINGRYIGVRPHTYLPLAIAVTVLNPLLGPVGILFAPFLLVLHERNIFLSTYPLEIFNICVYTYQHCIHESCQWR